MKAPRWAPAVVWLACALYTFAWLDRGWIPHDEGTLAHAAERVLAGELPHRDYNEVYTGGLSYANALAFLLFGKNLLALRIPLYLLIVLAWIPAMYYVARRFAQPGLACLGVALAVVWSIPNYTAAVPSWYNLALAILGTAALFRFDETGRSRWLALAGLVAGVSILIKIVGLYFLAAAGLFLLFRDQQIELDQPLADGEVGGAGSAIVTIAVLFLGVGVAALVSRLPSPSSYLHFVLPSLALVVFLVWNEWRVKRPNIRRRWRRLAKPCLALVTGAGLPVLSFVLAYALVGALGDLLRGVLVAPVSRFGHASVLPPPPILALASAPLFLFVMGERALPARPRWFLAVLAGALAVPVFVLGHQTNVYQLVWHSVRALAPLLVAVGILRLGLATCRHAPGLRNRSVTFLLLALLALWSLVQFPFSAPVYFVYVAPVVVLAALAISDGSRVTKRPVLTAILLFYLLFGLRWINPGFVYGLGRAFVPDDQTALLELERGGIRVSPYHKVEYETLVRLLNAHQEGGYTFVIPDSPEVYFLSGLRNPTPTIFEFLDGATEDPADILGTLDEHHVQVIAINRHRGRLLPGGRVVSGSFSPPPSPRLLETLTDAFPHAIDVGTFEVRWRE